MRIKWTAALIAVAALAALSVSLFAFGQGNIMANGKTGLTVGSVISAENVVTITASKREPNSEQTDACTDRRVQLLQDALAPISAENAVQSWAKFVQTRNGAAQFALLSPALRAQTAAAYKEVNWVTGVSSPYVSSYRITPVKRSNDGRAVYDVSFALQTSSGSAGGGTVEVTVGTKAERWLITGLRLKEGSNQLVGIVIVP